MDTSSDLERRDCSDGRSERLRYASWMKASSDSEGRCGSFLRPTLIDDMKSRNEQLGQIPWNRGSGGHFEQLGKVSWIAASCDSDMRIGWLLPATSIGDSESRPEQLKKSFQAMASH